MAKSNSKNIRVFIDWFGIDSKSKIAEMEACKNLHSLISEDSWEWVSDKSGFWVESGGFYFKHHCSNGKFFNYPIEVKNFDINDVKIVKITKQGIGKVLGSEAQRGVSAEVDPYYFKLAEKDLQENPTNEAGFDWEHLKQEMEKE
jgi:hypothetical protein